MGKFKIEANTEKAVAENPANPRHIRLAALLRSESIGLDGRMTLDYPAARSAVADATPERSAFDRVLDIMRLEGRHAGGLWPDDGDLLALNVLACRDVIDVVGLTVAAVFVDRWIADPNFDFCAAVKSVAEKCDGNKSALLTLALLLRETPDQPLDDALVVATGVAAK